MNYNSAIFQLLEFNLYKNVFSIKAEYATFAIFTPWVFIDIYWSWQIFSLKFVISRLNNMCKTFTMFNILNCVFAQSDNRQSSLLYNNDLFLQFVPCIKKQNTLERIYCCTNLILLFQKLVIWVNVHWKIS